ncbi:MAG: twin-arginine translocation signal domain-containing protein [Chloroflexota bacterium]
MTSVYHKLTRRTFLRTSATVVGAGALTTVVPRVILAQGPDGYLPPLQLTSPDPSPDDAATVFVGDVLEYRLSGDFPWNGGSVTFQLHEGRVDGLPLWYIHTDSSDSTFAEEVGLVWVPLLGAALAAEGGTACLYLSEGAAEAQLPVFSTTPGMDEYTPLVEIVNVNIPPDPVFGSAAPTAEAARMGAASRITVFANGLTGSGAMGFQPGVFRERPATPGGVRCGITSRRSGRIRMRPRC